MKKTLFLGMLLLMFTAIGCETTRGVGEDVENAGENVQEGVEDIAD